MSDSLKQKGGPAGAEFDINDVEVEILIVPKFPIAMGGPAQFLTKRGWPTKVEANVSKAIDYIMTHRPDFVLISVNHPHHNVSKLPMILGKTLDATCIAFAELTDAKSATLLSAAKVEHRIVGHPSGPNVYRSIRKILMERLNPGVEVKEESDGKVVEAGGNIIRFKAEPKDNHYGFQVSPKMNTIKGEEEGAAELNSRRKRLKDILGKADDVHDIKNKPTLDANQLLAMLEEAESSLENEGVNIFDRDKEDKSSIVQKAHDQDDGDLLHQRGIDANRSDLMMPESDSKSGHSHIKGDEVTGTGALVQEGVRSKEHSATQEEPKSGEGVYHLATDEASKGLGSAKGESTTQSLSRLRVELQAQTKTPNSNSPAEISYPDRTPKIKSELKSAGEEARIQGVNATELGLIEVDSDSLHGYLIFCRADGAAFDLKFIELVRGDIAKSLGGRGIRESMGISMIIAVPAVEVIGLCEDKCLFNFDVKTDYGDMVGGFISTPGRLPVAEPMPGGKMSRIQSTELSKEVPVTFDAYLYFKKSNKYIRYLKTGRLLLDRQIERIKRRRLPIYIRSHEAPNYRAYVAFKFVVSRVNEYLTKDKAS